MELGYSKIEHLSLSRQIDYLNNEPCTCTLDECCMRCELLHELSERSS